MLAPFSLQAVNQNVKLYSSVKGKKPLEYIYEKHLTFGIRPAVPTRSRPPSEKSARCRLLFIPYVCIFKLSLHSTPATAWQDEKFALWYEQLNFSIVIIRRQFFGVKSFENFIFQVARTLTSHKLKPKEWQNYDVRWKSKRSTKEAEPFPGWSVQQDGSIQKYGFLLGKFLFFSLI